jgi:hypothetical protein
VIESVPAPLITTESVGAYSGGTSKFLIFSDDTPDDCTNLAQDLKYGLIDFAKVNVVSGVSGDDHPEKLEISPDSGVISRVLPKLDFQNVTDLVYVFTNDRTACERTFDFFGKLFNFLDEGDLLGRKRRFWLVLREQSNSENFPALASGVQQGLFLTLPAEFPNIACGSISLTADAPRLKLAHLDILKMKSPILISGSEICSQAIRPLLMDELNNSGILRTSLRTSLQTPRHRTPSASPSSSLRLSSKPQGGFRCFSSGVYLITGAFGGIGKHLVEWLLERGAKYLMLTRSAQKKDIEVDLYLEYVPRKVEREEA